MGIGPELEILPSNAHLLNWQTRAVLGLLNMGFNDFEHICKTLNVTEDENILDLRVFIGEMLASPEFVIQFALKCGLPGGCAAELPAPNSVRCPKCGSKVSSVPCVSCSNANSLIEEVDFDDSPMPLSKVATLCEPGTPGKVEVMRLRVLKGESPFHPDDAILVHTVTVCHVIDPEDFDGCDED